MLKRLKYEELRAAISAEFGALDPIVLDGKTASLSDVFDQLRTPSLLQPYKLVVVDDAEDFVKAHREALERYAQNPVEEATLVLRPSRWYPGNLDKHIKKVGAIVKCDALKPDKARPWIVARAAQVHQRKLTPDAAAALVARLGCDLGVLDNEVAKLALLVEPAEPIIRELVTQAVGRASDEEAWAIQDAVLADLAVGGRGVGAALAKLHEVVDLARQPDVLVLYFVADLFRKLYLASMMQRQGVNDHTIGRELKLFPWERQQVFMKVLHRLDAAAAGRLFDHIVEMDVRAKSGLGDHIGNLECFCAVLADELQGRPA